MKKSNWVCIGVAVAGVGVLTALLSQKKCRDCLKATCQEGKQRISKCCKEQKGKICCSKEEVKEIDPNDQADKNEDAIYSETYYVNDQEEE